jgi:hypothetical protein
MSSSASHGPAPERRRRTDLGGRWAWHALDAVLILVFAVSGRRTHEHGLTVAGVLETAWPFLLAYALAFLLVRRRSAHALWPTAVVLWLSTVAGGLALRALSGAGVAPSFQVVTLLVLGLLLLLPRLAAGAVRRRRLTVA